ncbi:MAG: hypothetical protein ACRY3E_03230 [Candidatus Lariskella arthropodorum]|uniref:hypothetical protein n=1 Tax=Candidatus Lariskella endosymbiont of Epinotia ramella TaxID=3066224 RepID=UPI0030D579D5
MLNKIHKVFGNFTTSSAGLAAHHNRLQAEISPQLLRAMTQRLYSFQYTAGMNSWYLISTRLAF